jgi:hypothetical protein
MARCPAVCSRAWASSVPRHREFRPLPTTATLLRQERRLPQWARSEFRTTQHKTAHLTGPGKILCEGGRVQARRRKNILPGLSCEIRADSSGVQAQRHHENLKFCEV